LTLLKLLSLASFLALLGAGWAVAQTASPPPSTPSSAAPRVLSPDDYCRAFKELEKDVNDSAPIRGQGSLDLLQLKVSCQNKTGVYKRRLNSLVTSVSGAWREQQQRDHKQRHCDKNGIAYRYEWFVRDEIHNKEGKWLATLSTNPRDCARDPDKP
jgi:hypothetical protein